MRNSALASAALTSVALLAQTAGAAPSVGDETPSREEVSRRVSSLYDQAESDTGTFNATRAAATGPRGRVDRSADAGRRPAAAARNDESRRSDPALDNVTRQWFDAARAKVGPTVPATLPAAPVAELTSAPVTGTASVAELTAGPVAALPTAPEAPREAPGTTQSTQTALALPAPIAEPAVEPQQRSSLQATKEQNQRKLAQARELLSAYASQQRTPLAALEAPPAAGTWSAAPTSLEPWAETQWQALQGQGAADLTTVPPGTTAWSTTTDLAADTLGAATTGRNADTLAATTTGRNADTTTGLTTNTLAATTPGLTTNTVASTTTSQPLGTSTATTSTAPQDTRAARALEFARAQIGKPCVWGTTGPNTYDGAGLTQAAWKAAGINLPRTPQEQASAGRGIALPYLEPGDLVLFHVGHVGLYSGNGMMIHAPGPGASVREESIYYAGESAIHSAIRPA